MDADEQDGPIPSRITCPPDVRRAGRRSCTAPRSSPTANDGTIVVQLFKSFKNIDVSSPKLKKLVKAVCNRFKLSAATVSIAIVDDAQIRKLNKRFLNRKSATDCLSFDLSDNQHSPRLFELIVNGERAVKEANQRGHSSEAELALYVTHALLHNLGFDDSTETQAKNMHHVEDEILRQFGYGLVYNVNGR